MKKILTVSILLTLVVSSGAFAGPARWNALGGEHRFIIDTSNIMAYPGRATFFGNAIVLTPIPMVDIRESYGQQYFVDNGVVAYALLNVTDNMTLGYNYNLASGGLRSLRGALAGFAMDADASKLDLGGRLAALDLQPFPDVLWGMKIGEVSLGARLSLAMDSDSDATSTVHVPIMEGEEVIGEEIKPVEEITTSARTFDLSFGATMYETSVGNLDLGLSVGLQSFTGDDPNDDIEIASTGGMDIAFGARLNKPLSEDYTLVPLLSLAIGSPPSAEYDEKSAPNVTEVSYTKADLGMGFRKKVRERGLVVGGVLGGYGATTYKPTITIEKGPAEEGGEIILEKKEISETTDTGLNVTILAGCEYPINKWLIVRGGMNVKFAAITDAVVVKREVDNWSNPEENVVEEIVVDRKSTSVDYYYNMGFRTIYGGLIIDILLARNIVHRGPYFLTGAADGWATNVSLIYTF